jgi:hypothetical protein
LKSFCIIKTIVIPCKAILLYKGNGGNGIKDYGLKDQAFKGLGGESKRWERQQRVKDGDESG